MLQTWKSKYIQFRWRRRAKKKHCVGLHVRDVPGLLRQFEEQGIRAVVLRWFGDVPRTPSAEQEYDKDVDILIDAAGLDRAVELAANQPGCVRIDLYSNTGRRGSTYSGMPYYPPALADVLLAEREVYDSAFHVPRGEFYFRSLAYHMTYQKGTVSGIPTGCEIDTAPTAKREYGKLLAEIAKSAGVKLQSPMTLLSLHEELKSCGWSMPPDLLARWPKQTDWHRYLLAQEHELLRPWAERMPNLLVFFLRDDVANLGLVRRVCSILGERFRILRVEDMTREQIVQVQRSTRGGNWLKNNTTRLNLPRTAVICYDAAPIPVGTSNSAEDRRHREKFPLVKNRNVFFKHEIRERINKEIGSGPKLHGIHGSDNAYEAQHMLQAIFGTETEQVNRELLADIQARSASVRRAA